MADTDPINIKVETISPILNIRDMARSLSFYVDILGFTIADWSDENFTSVSRDNKWIYLCRSGQGAPGTWIWIGFDGNIFDLYESLKSKGVSIKLPPTNFSWAYELHIEDPDGHVIRLGTEPDEK